MSLVQTLADAKSEEDVKDAYIKAIGLKNKDVTKGMIDIQTRQVWFEAKFGATPPLLMFAQLLVYVRRARKRGEAVPPFLAVVDREKAAILRTETALPVFEDETIGWPPAASQVNSTLAAQIAPYIDEHFTTYPMATMATEFVDAIKSAIKHGTPIRIAITPDNLRQAFDKWMSMIGSEIDVPNPADYATIFFADIMYDGQQAAYKSVGANLVTLDSKPAFHLNRTGGLFRVGNLRTYRDFWSIYERPPAANHRPWLIERRDSLLPLDEQKFKGAFYTPLHIVDKAYEQLTETLGEGWQERYIVWDMCAGVGNLESKHNHLRNVYMSTLDEVDAAFMKTVPAFSGAEIFQYDYLNDDVTDFGEIDYNLSKKVPQSLRQAIADAKEGKEGAKPILVLINPPYAESGSGIGKGDGNKLGVEKTKVNNWMREMNLGFASKELFTQFLVRIRQELPTSILAMFSTLKYVNAPNFEPFRRQWTARFLGGFVVHSKAFDSLKGNFPIGFLIWDQSEKLPLTDIQTTVLDRKGNLIGEKAYLVRPNATLLNVWMDKTSGKGPLALPLSNALTVARNPRPKRQFMDAKGYFYASNNDLQHAGQETLVTSSIFTGGNGGGVWLTSENLWQAAIMFSVRMLPSHTWINHNDQFLQPTEPISDQFKSDCLVWMLFNNKNLTAGADGLEWDDQNWSLVNHFIPFTEAQAGVSGRYESDFMIRLMVGMTFSQEAQAVLDEGLKLWKRFHSLSFPKKIREDYRLGRPDAGWYQIRRSLEAHNDAEFTDFKPYNAAYAVLTEKLNPLVYEFGFLPS